MAYSIDSYSPPAIIIQEKKNPLPSVDEIIQWVNAKMEGQKLVLPESCETTKKQVEDIVWKRFLSEGLDKRYNGIEANFVEEWVWAICEKGSKNIQIYTDNHGKTIFSISGVIERAPIKAVLGDLGLKDVKWEDGIWRMYKTESDGKERIIEQSSPEYFHIFQDQIIFRADIYDTITELDPRIKYQEDEEGLRLFWKHNTLNLRVLKGMRDKGVLNKPKLGDDGKPLLDSQGSLVQGDELDEDLWKYGVKEAGRILKMQCVDPRFEEFASPSEELSPERRERLRLFRPIDREYIRDLYQAGWITQKAAIEADNLCFSGARKITGNTTKEEE